MRTEPDWIAYMPRMSRVSVVLPEPLRPTMPKTVPAPIETDRSSSAGAVFSL